MNHTINDDGESELIKTLSVESSLLNRTSIYARNKFDFNNRDIVEEPIYENISRISKNKFKGLSDLVKSRTRDSKLGKYAKRLKSKMIGSGTSIDECIHHSPINFGENGDSDDDINSYTSCQEENIYENLNFNFLRNWREDVAVTENDALGNWLEGLHAGVEDYECHDIMMTKCIPSKHKYSSCCCETDAVESESSCDAHHLELEDYKIEIINKCFASIWKQETEDDILKSLYTFLNDIFSTYFKRHSAHNNNQQQHDVITLATDNDDQKKLVVKRQRKMRENYDPVLCRSVDSEAIQKLETFILSVTVNRATITYDKCLKFYFALETSRALERFGAEIFKILKCSRLIVSNNQRYYGVHSRQQLRNFLKLLELILVRRLATSENSYHLQPCKAITESATDDALSRVEAIVKEENIYQPIWNWYTDSKSLTDHDDNDWETASDFSFLDVHRKSFSLGESMFRTVCILYSEEDSELNKLIYSYDSCSAIHESSDSISRQAASDELSQPLNVIQNNESQSEVVDIDSVKAWKNLIRQPYYLDDEEDLIMSETQIANLKLFDSVPNETHMTASGGKVSDDIQDDAPKSKLLTISNGSYELKSAISDTSIASSLHGNYRNITDNDSHNNSSESVAVPTEEPKKEREKLRDKFKMKLKLKSSRAPVTQEHFDGPKEIEPDYFTSNLATVEKALENIHVPKVVVECIGALESDCNINTPGLYRVSGNKTQIEAFKKKSNDKKASKKESTQTFLKSQDVHCVTGILKLFFRELSPPLMPSEIFVSCTADDVSSETISLSLKDMPIINYHTLKFLMAHLKRVEQQKDVNLMNSGNLAICWGLCIFSSSYESPEQFFENDISKCNMLCKKMIDYFGVIFKG